MRMLLRSMTFLLLVILARLSFGQTDEHVPAEVMESWSYLIGNWKIEGRVGSAMVSGSASFEWTDEKYCYVGRQVWKVGDEGRTIRLTLIGGWNAAENETVEQGFSSSGTQ